jgi:hypothetical protein
MIKFKLILTIAAFVLVFSSCRRKVGPLSCAADTLRYSEDLSNFLSNQSKGNCEAVKKSIEQVYKSCTTLSALDRADYEEFEESFNCNEIVENN